MQDNSGNAPTKTYPPDLGVLYENKNRFGQIFYRGAMKRKDGTKLELYGKVFEKEGVNAFTGQPEIKKYIALSQYIPNPPPQPQPAQPVQQTAPAATAPQAVTIDDDIPF